MNRRDLLTLLSGAAITWPHTARAQQKAMPVVGVLNAFSRGPVPVSSGPGPVAQGLGEVGYVEGQNLAIKRRWAKNHYDRLPALAAYLVSRNVDVIVALGGTPPALAAQKATSTIPIVFVGVADPVGVGLVASLARPGGNLTGFSNLSTEMMPKRFELLSELVPQAKVIALLVNPDNEVTEIMTRGVQEAAGARGVQLQILKANNEGEIDAAFASLAELRVGGLVIAGDAFLESHQKRFAALALRYAVPAIGPARLFAASGGLISYGTNLAAAFRQAGNYAGRILKGAKPADLPVQQSVSFETVINLNTAKALDLAVPQSSFARADELIE